MRDIERIDRFCNILSDIWRNEFPDWRFGQLIENVKSFNGGNDLFYIEESAFIQLLKEYVIFVKGE